MLDRVADLAPSPLTPLRVMILHFLTAFIAVERRWLHNTSIAKILTRGGRWRVEIRYLFLSSRLKRAITRVRKKRGDIPWEFPETRLMEEDAELLRRVTIEEIYQTPGCGDKSWKEFQYRLSLID